MAGAFEELEREFDGDRCLGEADGHVIQNRHIAPDTFHPDSSLVDLDGGIRDAERQAQPFFGPLERRGFDGEREAGDVVHCETGARVVCRLPEFLRHHGDERIVQHGFDLAPRPERCLELGLKRLFVVRERVQYLGLKVVRECAEYVGDPTFCEVEHSGDEAGVGPVAESDGLLEVGVLEVEPVPVETEFQGGALELIGEFLEVIFGEQEGASELHRREVRGLQIGKRFGAIVRTTDGCERDAKDGRQRQRTAVPTRVGRLIGFHDCLLVCWGPVGRLTERALEFRGRALLSTLPGPLPNPPANRDPSVVVHQRIVGGSARSDMGEENFGRGPGQAVLGRGARETRGVSVLPARAGRASEPVRPARAPGRWPAA